MSYIGKTPVVGNFQVCDAISTVNNQAAYTMQVSSVNVLPESVNNMLVSLNGVIQKPGSSFTISGSTITFSSALVTGDVINFIQIFGDVLSIGTPSDGVVTSAKLASNSVTTAKITDANVTTAKIADANVTGAKTNFVSTSSAAGLQIKGDGTTDGTLQLNCSQNSHGIKLKSPPHSASASYTLTFPNNDGDANQALTTNGSGVLTWANAGGANTPLIQVSRQAAAQTLTDSSQIKIAYDYVQQNVGGTWDTTNYRWTPGTAGKYFITASTMISADANSDLSNAYTVIKMNGNIEFYLGTVNHLVQGYGRTQQATGSVIKTMDDNDYIECFAFINTVSGNNARIDGELKQTWLTAYKIIV